MPDSPESSPSKPKRNPRKKSSAAAIKRKAAEIFAQPETDRATGPELPLEPKALDNVEVPILDTPESLTQLKSPLEASASPKAESAADELTDSSSRENPPQTSDSSSHAANLEENRGENSAVATTEAAAPPPTAVAATESTSDADRPGSATRGESGGQSLTDSIKRHTAAWLQKAEQWLSREGSKKKLAIGAGAFGLLMFVLKLGSLSREAKLATRLAEREIAAAAAERSAMGERLATLTHTMREEFARSGRPQGQAALLQQVQAYLSAETPAQDAQNTRLRAQMQSDLAVMAAQLGKIKQAAELGSAAVKTSALWPNDPAILLAKAGAHLDLGEWALEHGANPDCARNQHGLAMAALQAVPAETRNSAWLIMQARGAALLARAAADEAVTAWRKEGVARDLKLAELKRRAAGLAEQLRAEMSEEFKKRDQMVQDASAKNDPAKLAEAIAAKEEFDKKFDAERQRREADLQKETAAAFQASQALSATQTAAVEAWRAAVTAADQALESASQADSNPLDKHSAQRLAAEARCELSSVCSQMSLFPEAQAAAEKAATIIKEALTSDPSDALCQRLDSLASARRAEALYLQSLAMPAEQAKPLQAQGAEAAAQAVSLLAELARRSGMWGRAAADLGKAQANLSALFQVTGRADEAAALAKTASTFLANLAAADGSQDALLKTTQALEAARGQLAKSSAEPDAQALQAAAERQNLVFTAMAQRFAAWLGEADPAAWRSTLEQAKAKSAQITEITAALDRMAQE